MNILRSLPILLVLASTAVLHAAELQPVVYDWLKHQTNIQTWSADVTQIRRLKTLTHPLTATGQVWFAAPKRFRWEIGQPAQTIAIRQADQMLVIYPPLQRAERYSFNQAGTGPWKETLALLEAGFPRGADDLLSRFEVTSQSVSNEQFRLSLQPKSTAARRMLPQMRIVFSTNDLVLRATELEFADGSVMRNEFANPKLNPHLSLDLFEPKLDPSYKIVEPLKK